VLSRLAVATLDEARDVAAATVQLTWPGDSAPRDPRIGDAELAAERLPKQGGTIGPLPDGTVIEVERTGYAELWRLIGRPEEIKYHNDKVLVAYNAAQGPS
jgi:hypothetical protein